MIKTLAVVGATGAVGQIVLDEIVRPGATIRDAAVAGIEPFGGASGHGSWSGHHRGTARSRVVYRRVDVVIASAPDEVWPNSFRGP
ncbi:MAG: hypothetical protein R3C56_02170 [Pirellulaceae bacterium]